MTHWRQVVLSGWRMKDAAILGFLYDWGRWGTRVLLGLTALSMLGLKEMKCNPCGPCDCLVLNQSRLGKDRSKHIVGCCRTIVHIHLWVLKKKLYQVCHNILGGRNSTSQLDVSRRLPGPNRRTRSQSRHRCLCPRCARPSLRDIGFLGPGWIIRGSTGKHQQ